MSTVTEATETNTKRNSGRSGSSPSTTPGKLARNLDNDHPVWERQPKETDKAWAAFEAYRDSDDRKVTAHGPTAGVWSSQWSWGYRAFEYDKFLARKDAEDLVRYRRKMNERQRRAASLAQSKVIQWLMQLDPSTLSASEASRWLEVAVKIERLAGGAESERVAVSAQGPIEDMSAEDVQDALQALVAEVNRITAQ